MNIVLNYIRKYSTRTKQILGINKDQYQSLVSCVIGWVDGGYYPSHLPFKSGRARFRASGFRLSLFAHVYIIVTAFMNNYEIFMFPVVMITIKVMEVYPFIKKEFSSTISA
ncbi:hypothetical protein NIES4101_28530 [Calothrix sp. NIES-4101]|nr:hypothetical protein NIES4101_28310 [Calothrix sp. NIES-4101]BAZ36933.1 hypothetical protein NIES4101_28530 [Calothrix sp. NIES-4101]